MFSSTLFMNRSIAKYAVNAKECAVTHRHQCSVSAVFTVYSPNTVSNSVHCTSLIYSRINFVNCVTYVAFSERSR